jgi:hypothetical protein
MPPAVTDSSTYGFIYNKRLMVWVYTMSDECKKRDISKKRVQDNE